MGSVAAIFCMPERSHLQRLLPLIAGLNRRGVVPVVFTHDAFRAAVERAGGRPVDLFARYPLEDADATSRPIPTRYVTFAAHYAAQLIDEVARLRPSVVVYDTFAVIGFVIGRHLRLPYVNVCAGHNMSTSRAVALERARPHVAPSPACYRAVEALRERWGVSDASPFSYFTCLSPFLNVYCEPPPFLRPDERAAFDPIAFFGSVPPPALAGDGLPAVGLPWSEGQNTTSRVFVSFGSVVWRYYEPEALRVLGTLSDALGAMPRVRTLISLGGHPLGRAVKARLERPTVHVADYVDQWRALGEASVYVTHHGLNSTHEAIYHRVPMVSYPFFADQPGLATRCQELGLALPLAEVLQGSVSEADVRAVFARLRDSSAVMAASLARACTWEQEAMDRRDAIVQQILDFDGGR